MSDFSLYDLAVGPVGAYLTDKIIGDDVQEKIDHYEADHSDAKEAHEASLTDRKANDPTNQDLDAAAAEHYLFTRRFAHEGGDLAGVPGAEVLGAGGVALTLGYDALKAGLYQVADNPITAPIGVAGLEELAEQTGGVTDTLPSRPTLSSTLAGVKGGIDGAGEVVENQAKALWHWATD